VFGGGAHSDQGAQTRAAFRNLDRPELFLQGVDVNETRGSHDIKLHEIDNGRAAGKVLGRSQGGLLSTGPSCGAKGCGVILGTDVGIGAHCLMPVPCATWLL
jgi:hypothetical protein